MTTREEFERLSLSMLVSDIESARQVLGCINDVGSGVRLESMAVETSTTASVEVDVDTITPKQWEALTLAFEEGYYEQPRTVDLNTLAEELSISKSAVSQRLRTAESTLIESIVTEMQPAAIEG